MLLFRFRLVESQNPISRGHMPELIREPLHVFVIHLEAVATRLGANTQRNLTD